MPDPDKPPVDPEVGLNAPIPPWDPPSVQVVIQVQGFADPDPQEQP